MVVWLINPNNFNWFVCQFANVKILVGLFPVHLPSFSFTLLCLLHLFDVGYALPRDHGIHASNLRFLLPSFSATSPLSKPPIFPLNPRCFISQFSITSISLIHVWIVNQSQNCSLMESSITSRLLLFFATFVLSYLTYLLAFDARIELPRSGFLPVRTSPKRVLYVTDFGAIGDGMHDDTEAFANIWKIACSLSPQSKIVVPYGNVYLVRPIDFGGPCKSKVVFQIFGTLIAPKDPYVWHDLNPSKWIYFHGLNHLTMEGGGTINGMGQEWWAQSCKINASMPCHHAPTSVTFHRCNNLAITNLSLVDSPQMHVSFTDCMRVDVSNMSLVAPSESPNTDGIHISSSSNVVVRNSVIKTGDDCVSIVNNSSRVQIRDLACGPGHGISIGSLGKWNSCSEVHDILVDGAILTNTQNGVRIKTWQGGTGFAANITFRNVLMENVSNPIIVDQYYCDAPSECPNQTSAVKVDGISYVGIKGTSASPEAIKFACSDIAPCEGLYLEDVQLTSYTNETSSFCWEAQGSSSGSVFPAPCFPHNESRLDPKGSLYLSSS